MNNYQFESIETRNQASRSQNQEVALPALMRKVYTWMALALGITGLTSVLVASSPAIFSMLFGNQIVFWGIVIAELAIVFSVSSMIHKLSLSTATMLFVIYSVLTGVMLSSIFLIYTEDSIASVFFITAVTFCIMAFVGYTTKTDLSSMGKILLMALVGIILASVVNMFMHNSGLAAIINYVGVIIFVGLTAYDTQKIKQMLSMADLSEGGQKLALLGALTLYLDFINLFIKLLAIMGKRRD